jgi:peptide/nickel transport system substrate-binding protein
MRSRAAARLTCALALALALAGCGERPAARNGGTAAVAITGDLDFANPLVSAERWTQEINRFALFVPLVEYGPKLELQPRLAERWELLGDTGVVFHLRRGVRWSDGMPVTAEDALFTFQRAKDPETAFPNGDYFAAWTAGEAVDSYTVRFHFTPHAEPLAGLPFLPVVPKHALDSVPAARMREAAFNHAPVTDGPFRFGSYRANDRWTFEANPDFPAALGGRPHLDRLVVRIIPENSAQVTEVQTGGVDLATAPPAREFRALSAKPGVRGIAKPARQVSFIAWNGLRPQLADPRVRRAFAMAIDRPQILKVIRDGYGELAAGPIGSYHWAFDASLSPLPFAPDSAKALLAAAGYTDRNGDGVLENAAGRPLGFELLIPAANEVNRNLAELVRAQLARLGVQVKPRELEGKTFFAAITAPERRFDAAILGYEADFRLNMRDQFHSAALGTPFQLASYRNAEVDGIIDSTAVITDRARALPLWHRFQAIMRDEQPWTFLYFYPDLLLASGRLQGLEMDVRGALVNVHDWWVGAPAAGT